MIELCDKKTFEVSKQVVAFTSSTIAIMRHFAAELKEGESLWWSVAFDRDGEIMVAGGINDEVVPLAIADAVADIPFYWHTEPQGLDAVRKFCIHK